MKKISTQRRRLLVVAFTLLTTATAFAGNNWAPVYGQLKVYPTGAGKVYADLRQEGTVETQKDEDVKSIVAPGASFKEDAAAEQVDVKFAYKGLTPAGYFDGYAIPADGWVFAGWAGEKYVDGEPVVPTEAEKTDNPNYFTLRSLVVQRNDMPSEVEEAWDMMPEEPDSVYYALFTHVAAGITANQSRLGSVEIDKLVNDIGDEVTITATPREDGNTQFSHWVETSTGKQVTDNPYKLTVTGAERYEAVFTSDLLLNIDFPEEGGIIEWYRDNLVYFPETTQQVLFLEDSIKQANDVAWYSLQYSVSYVDAKTPAYLYAKGRQVFIDEPAETTPFGFSFYGAPAEAWSGENGVKLDTLLHEVTIEKVDTLVGDINGYLFDSTTESFKRVADGFVPANRVFLAVPQIILDNILEGNVPDEIFLAEDKGNPVGIEEVKQQRAANGKYYTIDGRQVAAPDREGIYIYDGKKLIFRRK